MTEVPEHLLKRAQAAKEKAASKSAEPAAPAEAAAPAAESAGDSRIPAHLQLAPKIRAVQIQPLLKEWTGKEPVSGRV